MLFASAISIALLAVVVSVASLGVSALQANIKFREFRHRREARIAVDPADIRCTPDHWEVELWLTNVGSSHARLVRVWLEDEHGVRAGAQKRLPRPLLAGAESQHVVIEVPKNDRLTLSVWPVRQWRDARQATDLEPDRSKQRIELRVTRGSDA